MELLFGLLGVMGVGALAATNQQTSDDSTDADETPETHSVSDTDDMLASFPEKWMESDASSLNTTLMGSDVDSMIIGRETADLIDSGNGDDAILGEDSNDVAYAREGQDTLEGGGGNDRFFSAADADLIAGQDGHDTLHSGGGEEVLEGGVGDDHLFLGVGDDTLIGLLEVGGTIDRTDADDSDLLSGGEGDDVILASENDKVFGGEGKDRIVLGDWIRENGSVDVMDYDRASDSLMLVWDDGDNSTAKPVVSIAVDYIDSDIVHVFVNGIPIAEVYGDPDLMADDVALIPLSSAEIVGLSPA